MAVTSRNIAWAIGLHTIQTTAFILIFDLFSVFPVWSVAASVLIVAAASSVAFDAIRAIYGGACGNNRGWNSQPLFLLYMLLSVANWALLFVCVDLTGPIISVATALVAALITKWVSQFVMKTGGHRTESVVNLSLSTALILLSALVVGKSKANTEIIVIDQIGWQVCVVLAFAITSAASQILKVMLTDEGECTARKLIAIRSDRLVRIELILAAIAAASWVAYKGETDELIRMLPSELNPTTWLWTHWAILWIGVVNLAIGLVVQSYLNNKIGLHLMVAVGQARPLIAKCIQVLFGTTVFEFGELVDLSAATVIALTAAAALQRKNGR